MNTNDLLNRYFEGETSHEEEMELRAFFTSDAVPERLAAYKPLFAYFDEEATSPSDPEKEMAELLASGALHQRVTFTKRTTLYLLSGVAASMLAILSFHQLYHPSDSSFCADNYVMINGRCYTDMHTVRQMAMEALKEVATPADTYFPTGEDAETAERAIIEDQISALGNWFNEDE